jgi:hypothetical protein
VKGGLVAGKVRFCATPLLMTYIVASKKCQLFPTK